jgi:RND family efflux transporter MFP subunit
MKYLNFIPIVFSSALLVTGCTGGTGTQSTEAGDQSNDFIKTERVKVMTLSYQTIGKNIEYTSTLIPYEEVHMVPSSPGRIEKIFVEVGSHVRQGDLLVQMDQTQLQQAILQLKNLEADYKRIDTLYKVGSVTGQQFDQISMQYEVAMSNVDYLKENTRLLAPFNGVVSGKYYENGEMYSGAPNTAAGKAAIISLVQIDPLKAMISVPESYFPQIREGMETKIISDIYPGQEYTGVIIRRYPTIDPNTHSFQAEIRIDNPGQKLRPGMFIRVDLELGETQALVVPALAVLKMQGSDNRYVFVEEQGRAKRIDVTIGQRFDDQVEIISPELKEGSRLIIAGQARLVDDVPVEVVTE